MSSKHILLFLVGISWGIIGVRCNLAPGVFYPILVGLAAIVSVLVVWWNK